MYQRTMVKNTTDELDDDDPDGVNVDIQINSIPADECEETCSTTTVAAISLSIPDSPVRGGTCHTVTC